LTDLVCVVVCAPDISQIGGSTGDAASMRGRRPSPGWIDSAALIVTHLRRDSENGD